MEQTVEDVKNEVDNLKKYMDELQSAETARLDNLIEREVVIDYARYVDYIVPSLEKSILTQNGKLVQFPKKLESITKTFASRAKQAILASYQVVRWEIQRSIDSAKY